MPTTASWRKPALVIEPVARDDRRPTPKHAMTSPSVLHTRHALGRQELVAIQGGAAWKYAVVRFNMRRRDVVRSRHSLIHAALNDRHLPGNKRMSLAMSDAWHINTSPVGTNQTNDAGAGIILFTPHEIRVRFNATVSQPANEGRPDTRGGLIDDPHACCT